MSAPQPIRPGTATGARAHYRHGERPCELCRVAANAARHGDPYRQVEPVKRGAPRNGLPATPLYQWRARSYPWAVAALRRAEVLHGTAESELEAKAS